MDSWDVSLDIDAAESVQVVSGDGSLRPIDRVVLAVAVRTTGAQSAEEALAAVAASCFAPGLLTDSERLIIEEQSGLALLRYAADRHEIGLRLLEALMRGTTNTSQLGLACR